MIAARPLAADRKAGRQAVRAVTQGMADRVVFPGATVPIYRIGPGATANARKVLPVAAKGGPATGGTR